MGSPHPPKSPAQGPPGEFSALDMSYFESLGEDFGGDEPTGSLPWPFTPFLSQLESMNIELELPDSMG